MRQLRQQLADAALACKPRGRAGCEVVMWAATAVAACTVLVNWSRVSTGPRAVPCRQEARAVPCRQEACQLLHSSSAATIE